MADSQPGKVTTFDPSVSLDSFAADARDRLMYNENQLALAKIQQPVPVAASSYLTAAPSTVYDKYVNIAGEFAYTDGSFQALKTSGVPTTDVDTLEIGFDQQVTTTVVTFWSTAHVVTSASLTIFYSFDNNTWFDVGTITWDESRDESIQQFPGDSPPSGEYVYEGTFDSGSQTGRYWRVSHSANTTFVNYLTEIEILPNVGAVLEHWGSDGTKAVTNQIEGSTYYDLAYDKADDVYYAIRFDDTLPSSLVLDPDDSFDSLTDGSLFDAAKWMESEVNSYFIRSTSSGTLGMKSSAGAGQLETNYGVDGDFKSNIEVVAAVEMGADAYFALETKDYTTNNQYTLMGFQGPYTPGVDTASATYVSCYAAYTDTVGDSAVLQDFRVKPDGLDFTVHDGSIVAYELSYNAGTDDYTVTASGVTTWPNAEPGVPYTALDSAEFTISHLSTPSDGQGFSIDVYCTQDNVIGSTTSGIGLEVERTGTNAYLRFADPNNPGVYGPAQVGNIPADRIKLQIFGDPAGNDVDFSADDFILDLTVGATGTLFFSSPVFSVVTINKDGDLEQVASVSDADGYAIKILDIIQDLSATYNDYLHPKVSIATNGALHGSGGEIYIKVNDTMYRYLKSALPLVSEDGTGAATSTVGEIPSTGITGFAYNGYTQGGLSYVEYVPGLGGTFVKTITNDTLLAQPEKVFLDVATDDFQFAWNVVDLATLYYVDGTDLKLYDLNETKAAFANVSSDKQVLAAGTQETATVTAQILNVYGEPKSNKTMTFTVSAGDGAISPAIGCSDGNGEDTTVYTVGSAVGAATITVTVSDLTC
jgi:hypothetical protein